MASYNYDPYTGYYVPEGYQHGPIMMPTSKEHEMLRKKQVQLEIADSLNAKDSNEYGEEILDHMFNQELQSLPCVESIDIQTEIQWYMRPYLLDFLIEAHAAFGLMPETLFLAVNILDRYCSKRVVYRKHYQLVGCTALLVASKYGECSKKVPHVKELASMCCGLYDEDMFIQMERHVMITLDWFVGAPTIDGFLQMALDETQDGSEVEHMSQYISEIAMFHRDFVSKRPSDLAKASVALARIILNREAPCEITWAANYDSDILVALSQHLHRPSQVLLQKYKYSHMSKASETLDLFLTKHAAIAKYNAQQHEAAPPTPPAEVPRATVNGNNQALLTPQKPSYPSTMVNGCLTPPITPDIETFHGFDPTKQAPGTPSPMMPTPASSSHLMPEHAHYRTSYYPHGMV